MSIHEIHSEYMQFVANYVRPSIANSEPRDKFGYFILKLFSETGELVGQYCKREYHNPKMSNRTLIEEAGDCLWYFYNIMHACDKSMQETIFRYIDDINSQKRNVKLVKINLAHISHECGTLANLWIEDFITSAKTVLGTKFLKRLKFYIYYLMAILKSLDLNFFDVINNNIAKIKKRHGQSYNEEFYQEYNAVW